MKAVTLEKKAEVRIKKLELCRPGAAACRDCRFITKCYTKMKREVLIYRD